MQEEAAGKQQMKETLRKVVFRPSGEISEDKRMDEGGALELAKKLKNACDLFWRKGLVNTDKSLLRVEEPAKYRIICQEIHQDHDSTSLSKLIQKHTMLGVKF